LNLYGEVNTEDSKFSLETRNIFLNIKKAESGPYWPRLTKESGKLNFLACDWGYYVDEDEEDELAKDPNRGNMQGKID
jgi:prostaglandin-E synthase